MCQALSVSIAAANRLSAIMFPHRYAEFWCGRRLQAAIAIQIIPGYLLPLLILRNEVTLERTERGGVIPKKVSEGYFTAAGIFLTTNSIFLVVAYCWLFYVLRRRRHSHNKVFFFSKKKKFRLPVAVQIIFLLFIFFEAFPVIPYSTVVSYILYNPISNLYSGISAYLLWIFSEDLRRYVYVLLGIRKRTTVVTVANEVSRCIAYF
ncbi:unnamed protein product [Haemonchus placei]|uniref:G_PROTEIN_RECEP_F1_2 domain-containing protein n=1 Tax=Haemonchus placei TaxID=6290 RepID=A0A0N4WSG6_HAEPC|nr:unnamed protein product [Haemonchus placei]